MVVESIAYHLHVGRKITVEAAAQEVGVHEQTIWRWLRAGVIARHKSKPGGPRRTLVDLDEVRRVKQTPPPAD